MRSFNLLLASLAMSLVVQTASAQRATLAVTARLLPSAAAMAAGTVAPRLESGHTIVATGLLSDVATMPSTVVSAGQRVGEFKLGVAVAANVQYHVAVSSNVDLLKIQKRSASGRQEISYRVVPAAGKQAPAPVVVTLTAASIS